MRGFKLYDTLLEHFLVPYKFLNLEVRVFASIVFQHLQTLSQVFILILKLVNLAVLIIDQLWLLLDSLSQTQVALQNFFHHVDRLNDSACDCILSFVCSIINTLSILSLILLACL